MSRYGHLTDGCLDLILVEKVNTREFTRYLKRHIKSKDQVITGCIYRTEYGFGVK